MRYEVRCCCQPRKLLGWIDGLPEYAQKVRLALDGGYLELPVIKVPPNYAVDPEFYRTSDGRYSQDLRLARRRVEDHLAIKAEGVSIGTLRRVPGFIEAN